MFGKLERVTVVETGEEREAYCSPVVNIGVELDRSFQ